MYFRCSRCRKQSMQYSGGAGKLICYNCGLTIRCSNADELWDIMRGDDFAFMEGWERDLILNVHRVNHGRSMAG